MVAFGAVAGGALGAVGGAAIVNSHDKKFPDEYYLPFYRISPQEIFADQIPALHINFINPRTYEGEEVVDDEGNPVEDENGNIETRNSAKELAPIISKWYVAIRNVVLVALMVVLLYIGIRIVLSTTASEKAKYQENIKDWLVAIIILVFMHYIMAFALTITEYITEMLRGQNSIVIYPIEDFDIDAIEDEEARATIEPAVQDGTLNYATNLMGYARIQTQLVSRDDNGNALITWERIGYIIIYAVLVIYTVMFLIVYFKRVIYMAFLTIIAPLVALTYPIDKLNDGKSQAFDMWLKEYLYNLLLQPFHLLLYTLLVGSAIELATTNMVYAIVAIGFLLPAEKLLRKFFGFEKSETAGAIMGGAVGGAMAMTAINQLGKIRSLGSRNKGKGNSDDSGESEKPIRTADKGSDDLFAEGLGGQNNNLGIGNGQSQTTTSAVNTANRQGENTNNESFEANQMMNMQNGNANSSDMRFSNANLPGNSGENINGLINNNRDIDTLGRNKKQKIKAAAKVAGRFMGRGLLGAARRAPAAIAKGYGMATVGTMGAIAGLASDDYSNVLKYGAAGVGIGYAAGGAVASTASNVASNVVSSVKSGSKTISNDYLRELYGADAGKAANRKLDDKFLKDKEAIKNYKEAFGKADYKEAMQNALKYREYGVTDDKMIIKAMQLEGLADSDATSKERISLAKIASTAKSEKELQDYGKRLGENGISEERIKEVNKIIRKMQKS